MKLRSMLRRLGTSAQLLRREPQALLRIPRFVGRMLQEGPAETLMRLRQLSDPLRFVQNYPLWLEREHNPTAQELVSMRGWAEGLAQPPLISVVMPVFNPKPEWLQEAIASVQQQVYPHWQLCIADDCSTDPLVRQVLEQAQAADPRVEVVFRQENGHISSSSNSALTLVRGDWVALLDHDDLLPPEALVWVARTVLEQPQAQLIYSDEDKIDEAGQHSEPYFKPDWNPALIEGQNLFSHLGVYRADLIRKVGGFRVGLEGSQDYDLLLRCLDVAGDRSVVHVPRVLYHWRVHRQSTASGNAAKPYVVAAAERALSEHLARRGEEGKVQALPQGYRIQRQPPQPLPVVDVLLDARAGVSRTTLRSLQSLLASTAVPLRVHIVLGFGQEPLAGELSMFAKQQGLELNCVLEPRTIPTAQALDQLRVAGSAPLLLFWDLRLLASRAQDTLQELVGQLQGPEVAAAGPKLLYPNGTISHAGLLLSATQLAAPAHRGFGAREVGYFGRANLSQDFSALPLPGLLIRRSALEDLGALLPDARLAPHWTLDLCLRLRQAGLRITYTPFAEWIWNERFSRGADPWPGTAAAQAQSAALIRERWWRWLDQDPAFSPNLCNDPVNFSLAWPPRLARWSDPCRAADSTRDAVPAAHG